jgi:threonine/homoserine/homoserine lactone efflux protein
VETPILSDLLVGVALGFSLTVPPGPMNALIASISTRSRRGGVLTGLGAMTADLVLGGLVFALDSSLDLRRVVEPIYVVGCAVMLYFAVRLLLRRGAPLPPLGDVRTFSRALGIGLSNPYQILWWLTAGVAFAYLGGIVLLAGLFGAIAVWIVVFPFAIHAGSRRYPRLESIVVYASGAILLGFVVYFAWLAIVSR